MSKLEKIFDNAPIEATITRRSPGIGGRWVSAIELPDGTGVIELKRDKPLPSGTYEYKALSVSEVERVKAIEFDPYNDAAYTLELFDFWDNV
jgi:hypothetical protein